MEWKNTKRFNVKFAVKYYLMRAYPSIGSQQDMKNLKASRRGENIEENKNLIISKYKCGRQWTYRIVIEPLDFAILLSDNQLRKIRKEKRGRLHIDFEPAVE